MSKRAGLIAGDGGAGRHWLVVSRHNFDNFPVSLHSLYSGAQAEAKANHRRGGPTKDRSLPTWDVTGYLHTAIVEFDGQGRPVKCEMIGGDEQAAAMEV